MSDSDHQAAIAAHRREAGQPTTEGFSELEAPAESPDAQEQGASTAPDPYAGERRIRRSHKASRLREPTPDRKKQVFEQEYSFPCGLLLPDGGVARRFWMTPLGGEVRLKIAQANIRSNGAKIVTQALSMCITRIEGIDRVTPQICRQMLVADRDYAMMYLQDISQKEDSVKLTTRCACKAWLEVDRLISRIEVVEMDPEDQVNVIRGYRTFTIQSEEFGWKGTFRWPCGEDAEKIFPMIEPNPIEADYRIKVLTCMEWNGGILHQRDLQTMSGGELDEFDELMEEYVQTLGPDLEPFVNCEVCGRENYCTMDVTAFLFGSDKRRRRRRRSMGR